MQKFKNLFQDVPDPRADNARHDLVDVLVIALAAVLCGADNCADMAEFGCAKEALLRQFLRLEHGIPSHDTFSRIFRLLDPQAFEPVFRRFLAEFAKELHGVVAVDGKALRGAFARPQDDAAAAGQCVGRRGAACDCPTVGAQAQRGRRSIGSLGAAGTRWLHCHRRRAALPRRVCPVHSPPWRTIRFGAQGQPIGAVYRRADTAGAAGRTSAGTATSYRQPWPRRTAPSGGRACGRTRAQARLPWNQSAIELQRRVGDAEEPPIVRYFLLSRRWSPARVLAITRAHWGIENQLHWVLDVVFDEDRARNRKDHGPENLAILRKLALNTLRSHPSTASIRRKIKRAGWDDAFLTSMLAQMR